MLDKTGSYNRLVRQSICGWVAALGWGVAALTMGVGCGSEDEGITYRKSVRPLLQGRCTVCHRSGGPIPGDLENPFARETGMVDAINTWGAPDAYPGESPVRNIVPGDPDNSFLIDKLSDPSLGVLPDNGHGGSYMPLNYDPLTAEEIGKVEQWVTDGANDDDFYRAEVQPIFGEGVVGRDGKCSFCHYEGTPNPPNLINPFGPDGLINPFAPDGEVGIPANFRSDLDRVEPGNPDASFLILKIRATVASGENGIPMPYAYNALTSDQVEVVAQWIREGALNN